MRVIIVSGTPGTGKTTIAKMIAKNYNYKYLDVNLLITKNKLSSGFDKKRDCEIIDTDKLNLELIEMINSSINKTDKKPQKLVIDSHLSHYLPSKYVDLCIITKCDLRVLKKRLEKRGYSAQKVRENLDAEIFDTCLVEAGELGHNIVELFTDTDVSEQLRVIFK